MVTSLATEVDEDMIFDDQYYVYPEFVHALTPLRNQATEFDDGMVFDDPYLDCMSLVTLEDGGTNSSVGGIVDDLPCAQALEKVTERGDGERNLRVTLDGRNPAYIDALALGETANGKGSGGDGKVTFDDILLAWVAVETRGRMIDERRRGANFA
jgi:hypothetical protein